MAILMEENENKPSTCGVPTSQHGFRYCFKSVDVGKNYSVTQ